MIFRQLSSVLVALSWLARLVAARQVYAHYMVGTLNTTAHAEQDIIDAQAMGFDGFALNVGDPTADFLYNSLTLLFDAATKYGFQLYISMDVYASGTACYSRNPQCLDVYSCFQTGLAGCNGPYDYQWIWDNWKGSTTYATYNSLPIISSFSSGGYYNTTWADWKLSLANDMYFIPDFDETDGYYDNAEPWEYWGSLMDGLFSWESAWPKRAGLGGEYPGDVSLDVTVMEGAHSRGKEYMIGLSPLQYKDSYGANVYRQGDDNLPARMHNILTMDTLPDFVVFFTWNDGPEAHYVGNLWPESNTDAQPAAYTDNFSHDGWRPLVAAFNYAYKNSLGPSAMMPQTTDTVVGAAWYKTILPETVVCSGGDGSLYYEQPSGFLNGTNSVWWSVILDPSAGDGYSLTVYTPSSTDEAYTVDLVAGLNYGSGSSLTGVGPQLVVVTGPDGSIISSATGGMCVSSGCPSGIYNSNYQVLPFSSGSQGASCTEWSCQSGDCLGDSNSQVVYIDPGIWYSADPTIACSPPCTFVLPPWTLSTVTTITIDPITQTVEDTWPITTDGLIQYTTVTTVTVITVPAITTSIIPVSNIIWSPISPATTPTAVNIISSIEPAGVTMTEAIGPNSQTGITYVYSLGPYPTPTYSTGTSSTTAAAALPISVPPGMPSRITLTTGTPQPTCPFPGGCGGNLCQGSLCGGTGGISLPKFPCIGLGCPSSGGSSGSGTPCVGNGCGDTSNDNNSDSSSSTTSTCATQTATECYQVCTSTPCTTICNTYRGCDCTTSTVTDYWVACMSSTCTTTSSDVITGCYVTATTTTTGASCPTSFAINPSTDDEGDDAADLPLPGEVVTVVYPESVVAGGTPYSVSDGSVTIGSVAYSVPSVASPVATQFGGAAATIYPQVTGASISITLSWMTVSEMAPAPTTTSAPSKTGACISAAITYTSKASGESTWQDTVVAYGSEVCSGTGSCSCTDWTDSSCESGYSFKVSFQSGDLTFSPIVTYDYLDENGNSQVMTFSTESPDEVGPCKNNDAGASGSYVDDGGSDCVFTYKFESDSC